MLRFFLTGIFELLPNSICGNGETRLSLYGKNKSQRELVFLLTTTFCLTNPSILFTISYKYYLQ